MYEEDHGIARDNAQTVAWCREAAERSDAEAPFALGAMYRKGCDVTQSDTQATVWFRKAAEQGYKPLTLLETQRPEITRTAPEKGKNSPQSFSNLFLPSTNRFPEKLLYSPSLLRQPSC
ncbi:MAG: sel1 repeat family protein [Proteobacteria bacterium]|nr:sel1 repeat family protein [Pseudomonadota bacterium]